MKDESSCLGRAKLDMEVLGPGRGRNREEGKGSTEGTRGEETRREESQGPAKRICSYLVPSWRSLSTREELMPRTQRSLLIPDALGVIDLVWPRQSLRNYWRSML